MKIAFLALVLTASIGIANARFSYGKCNDAPVLTGFEPEKYLGKWYEYSRLFVVFQVLGTCTVAVYSDATTEEGVFRVGVHNMDINKLTGKLEGIEGYAVLSDPDDPDKTANLIVNFDTVPVKQNSTNYSVLETDYDEYAIVYSCSKGPLPNTKIEDMWILTRQQFPDTDKMVQIYDKLKTQGFETDNLMKTVQTNCPDMPDN